jgi:hypothetical protein
MKVKELIEKLQELNPEKNIWIFYDLCSMQEPTIDTTVDKETASQFEETNEGDYLIEAW